MFVDASNNNRAELWLVMDIVFTLNPLYSLYTINTYLSAKYCKVPTLNN